MFHIDVTDNGSGMTEETQKKLFTSFFSTKGGKGTGIGSIVGALCSKLLLLPQCYAVVKTTGSMTGVVRTLWIFRLWFQ